MENLSLLEEDNLWKPMVMVEEYKAKSKLSESLTSTVWLAKHKLTGEEAVLKCFDLSKLNLNLRSCLDNELDFLSSVDHPNIIRLLEVFQVTTPFKIWVFSGFFRICENRFLYGFEFLCFFRMEIL